ncbi:MAG: O-antigen ligase family protein [Anaerolineae bacterium]|nr:O-antigen ligase family protein [Anaerolineae bacterium]
MAVLLLAGLAPFQPVQPLAHSDLTDLHTGTVLALLVLTLWLAHLVVARRRPRPSAPLTVSLGLFLAMALLAACLAPSDRLESVKFVVRLGLGAGACLAVADQAATATRRTRLIQVMVSAAGLVGLLGLAEYAGLPLALALLDQFKLAPTHVGEAVRISATFAYPTITSMYLELVIPLAVALLWLAVRGRRRGAAFGWVLMLALITEAMILTFTRTGLVAAAAALLVLVGGSWRLGWRAEARLALGAIGLVGVLVAGTALLTPTLGLRLATENDRAWYGVTYAPAPLPSLAASDTVMVAVTVTNTGRLAWSPALPRPVSLSYHWLAHNEESVVEWEGPRVRLPLTVEPGQSVTLAAPVIAPSHSGPVRLAWDMVQDNVTWFSAKAVPMYTTRVDVLPRRVAVAVEPPPILLKPMPAASRADLSPSRRTLWAVAVRMARDRPLLGVGPDNFRLAYGRYTGQDVWDPSIHSNNMYLEMFADMGIPGGLAFLLFTAVSLALAVQGVVLAAPLARANLPGDPLFVTSLAAAASLVAWLAHGVLDSFYAFLPLTLIYWTILGLVAAGVVHRPRQDPRDL